MFPLKKSHFIIACLIVLSSSLSFGATWQEVLQSKFKVAETFDELQDWRGGTGYHFDPGDMPKKLDGSQSIWDMYSNDGAAVDDWIKDHGAYKWGTTGKSLCMNYNDFSGGIDGYGPSRLGVFLGDGITGKSGFKKIHIFFMAKFHPGFFAKNTDGSYQYVGTLKFFDMCSGFTDIDYYGTPEEHQTLDLSKAQVTTEYGTNDTVINLGGGGLSNAQRLYFMENTYVSNLDPEGWDYTQVVGSRKMSDTSGSTDFDQFYENDQWFGVEIVADIGTVDKADGSLELTLYDQKGNKVGYWGVSGYNKLVHFDHYYNKVTLGGNRICSGYGSCPEGQDNRFYVDDFIIDDQAIASNYFSALSAYQAGDTSTSTGDTGTGDTTTAVTAPTGLKIISTQ